MTRSHRFVALPVLTVLAVVSPGSLSAGDGEPQALAVELRVRCAQTLRQALVSTEFWPSIHAAEALTLAGAGNEVATALAARLPREQDDQKRCGLARELVRAGRREHLEVLLQVLADPKSSGRVHAAESLFKLGESAGRAELQSALAQQDNVALRLWAAAALAQSGDREALSLVRQHLTSTVASERSTAAFALALLATKSDAEPLASALAAETDPVGQTMFAGALACLHDARGSAALDRQLTANDPAVRTLAADLVGRARCREHRARLIGLLDDSTLDARVRAAQSLLTISTPARLP